MTTAAKKAAATKADQAPETATEAVAAAPSADPTPPPTAKKVAANRSKLDLAQEQRTANLIAVLGLGKEAWADLFAAGVDAEDGPASVAQAVAERLGLIEVD